MATALIFAGGTGQRMNPQSKPKQFLELHGKPILIYTIEHFENHPEVTDIVVVCIEEWIERLERMIEYFQIKKVVKIIAGGETGDKSIYLGLQAMKNVCKPNDIVLIHDGVRPLIDKYLISENITKATKHGCVITVAPTVESVYRLDDEGKIIKVSPRVEMFIAKAPQTFRYELIVDLYERAYKDGNPVNDSAHLCHVYGITPHTIVTSTSNIKITDPSDYYVFKALFEALENQQILGL